MKRGYDATSMSDISSKVGINKASLYYFFKDKEHLYFEIMKIALDNILFYLRDIEKNKKYDFVEIIENLIKINSEDSIIAYVLDTDSIDKSSRSLQEIHKGISRVHEIFKKICREGGIKDPAVAAEVTLNAIHAYTIKSSCHKITVRSKDYAKYLSQLLEKNK